MRSQVARARRLAAVPVVLLSAAFAAPAAAAPSPGAPGIGDPLFPGLGNGGYDAQHYDLALTYPTSAPLQQVTGSVTMLARATQDLSRFNLDFAGDAVLGVKVNGSSAAFTYAGEELVITPRRALDRKRFFVVSVDFRSHTRTQTPEDEGAPFGWFTTADGSVMAGQPDFAHEIYPSNDHPADKATYSFRIDVPEGTDVAASGVLVARYSWRGRSKSTFVLRQPMASELIQVAVGDLAIIDRGRHHGVPIRDVAGAAVAAAVEPALARTPDHLEWMIDRVGRYPFDVYGVLAADEIIFYALETQTLSLHPAWFLSPPVPPSAYEPVMVHELAHQWFGDSVAPVRWSDLWLNEGHATWYELEYADQFFGQSLAGEMRQAYAEANQLRAQFGPVARPSSAETLFSNNVYDGGALVLFALREVIGDPAFRAVQRGWAQRMRDESVSTEDFIAFVNRTVHRDLTGFLRAWLYGTTVPPMPNHPDWTADPVAAEVLRTAGQPFLVKR